MTDPAQTPLEDVVELLRGQRRRWRKWFAAIGVVIALVVANQVRVENVADDAQDAADKAQEAIELVVAQRNDARLSACLDFNETLVENLNGLNDEVQALAVDAFADPGSRRTTSQAALVEQFLEAKVRAFEARKVGLRDCSRQGIDDFYARRAAQRQIEATTSTTTSTTSTVIAGPPSTSRRASTSTTPTTRSSSTTSTTYPAPTTTLACTVVPGLTVPREIPCPL